MWVFFNMKTKWEPYGDQITESNSKHMYFSSTINKIKNLNNKKHLQITELRNKTQVRALRRQWRPQATDSQWERVSVFSLRFFSFCFVSFSSYFYPFFLNTIFTLSHYFYIIYVEFYHWVRLKRVHLLKKLTPIGWLFIYGILFILLFCKI